jgi:hypothetical protein
MSSSSWGCACIVWGLCLYIEGVVAYVDRSVFVSV